MEFHRVRSSLPLFILPILLLLAAGPAAAGEKALLIGAGQYASGKWALPLVDENLRLLEEALVDEVGVAREAVVRLVDSAVTRTGVMRVLREIARSAGEGDRLYIYYTGHGTRVAAGGATVRACFTWDTIEAVEGGGFDPESLITDVDLKRWLAPLRKKGVFVVFFREACYSGGGYGQDIASLSPGRPPSREPIGDLEISACDVDQAAWALEGARPPRALFTSCLAGALADDALTITARDVFDRLRGAVSEKRAGQNPILECAPGVDPAHVLLVDRTCVDLVVDARDGVTDEPIAGATVTLAVPGSGRVWTARTPGALLSRVERRGALYPSVTMKGYITGNRKIILSRKEGRLRVTVTLFPEVAEVTGRLVIIGEGEGSLDSLRVAYESGARPVNARHVDTEVRPEPDGAFRIRVPPHGSCRIIVVKGAESFARADVNGGEPLKPYRAIDRAGGVYYVGVIPVPLPPAAAVLSEAEQAFDRYFRKACDEEEAGDLESALNFYELACCAADLVADGERKTSLVARGGKAVERIEAVLLSDRYNGLVKEAEEAAVAGELVLARDRAADALGLDPAGVTARLLLESLERRIALVGGEGAAARSGRNGEGAPADAPKGFEYLRQESFSCLGVSNRMSIYRHERTGLEFVLVPGGELDLNEGRETVTIEPFLICRTECTQEAWDRIGGNDDRRWSGRRLPIERVSWNGTCAWCRKTGLRLPTMAEWEYAGRGGVGEHRDFFFGASVTDLGDYAWYGGNSGHRTHPVAMKKPNAFGLYDVHGNVMEWCADSDSPGPDTTRYYRGGCYYSYESCSFGHHNSALLDGWSYNVGFRPAADFR